MGHTETKVPPLAIAQLEDLESSIKHAEETAQRLIKRLSGVSKPYPLCGDTASSSQPVPSHSPLTERLIRARAAIDAISSAMNQAEEALEI